LSYYNGAPFSDIIGIPSLAINGYLWDTMKEINPDLGLVYGDTIPFYPIGDSAAADEPWDNKPYFIYDRVFRFSSKPFYEHKRESTLYYLKAREVDSLEWSAVIQAILDREDDSAKDINDWIRSQENHEEYPFYFHNVRIYQSRSSSPSSEGKIREVSTVQPYYITEFMIDTHFHYTKQFIKTPRVEDLDRYPEGNLDINGNPVFINGLLQYDQEYKFYVPDSNNQDEDDEIHS
jgi:hypothetical protein